MQNTPSTILIPAKTATKIAGHKAKNIGMTCAQLRSCMGKRVKIFIILALALLLLYSGAAWAVLGCCHDETHSYHEAALNSIDQDFPDAHGVDANITCVSPVYHTDSRAVSSLRSQLELLTPDTTPHLKHFWLSPAAYAESARAAWLTSRFGSAHPTSSLLTAPLYLFLSILRI